MQADFRIDRRVYTTEFLVIVPETECPQAARERLAAHLANAFPRFTIAVRGSEPFSDEMLVMPVMGRLGAGPEPLVAGGVEPGVLSEITAAIRSFDRDRDLALN